MRAHIQLYRWALKGSNKEETVHDALLLHAAHWWPRVDCEAGFSYNAIAAIGGKPCDNFSGSRLRYDVGTTREPVRFKEPK